MRPTSDARWVDFAQTVRWTVCAKSKPPTQEYAEPILRGESRRRSVGGGTE